MNFLHWGFQKLSSDRHAHTYTNIQRDRHDRMFKNVKYCEHDICEKYAWWAAK